MRTISDKIVKENLMNCFKSILQLVDLDVVELWTSNQNGFSLLYICRGEELCNRDCNRTVLNDEVSKKLCAKSMESLDGFYVQDTKSSVINDGLRCNSRISFHLPRDNLNSDVFIVGYAAELRQFSGSKLNILFWLGHSVCAIAFAREEVLDDKHRFKNEDSHICQVLCALHESSAASGSESDAYAVRQTSTKFSKLIRGPVDVYEGRRRSTEDFNTFATSCGSDVFIPSRFNRDSSGDVRYNVDSNSTCSSKSPTFSPGTSYNRRPSYTRSDTNEARAVNYAREFSSVAINEDHRMSPSKPDSSVYTEASSVLDDQPGSGDQSRGDGSITSSVGPMSSNITIGSALTSITGATRTRAVKSQRTEKTFDFNIIDLRLLRNINRRVDLNEMLNLEYVTGGSHSQIYSATWQNQSVIVKILSEQKANHAIAIHEFDVECELLARLNHPNIASILGGGVIPRPFIVMERLRDLSEVLNLAAEESNPTMFRNKVFKYVEVLQLARDLAIALKYLHTEVHPHAMVIHRDLKPENLGLAPDGSLKLFDFGLCRLAKKRTSPNEVYEMTGNTGSLRYMAPEVVLGKPYTEKVDVYSFAMIMWTLARNKSPFKGFDRTQHRTRVVVEGERPKMDSDWPVDFINLLEVCWHQDSFERPTFEQITAKLEKMIDSYIKDPSGLKTKTKGLSFLKSMFSKR